MNRVIHTRSLLQVIIAFHLIVYTFPLKNALALDAVNIDNGTPGISLGRHVEILEDKEGKLGIAEVSSGSYNGEFYTHKKENINLGLSRSVFWLRFTLQSAGIESGADRTARFLDMGTQYVYYADLYTPVKKDKYGKDGWIRQSGGTLKVLGLNELVYKNVVFSLPALDREPSTFYLRVESKSPYFIPLKVVQKDELDSKLFYQLILFGMFYGVMTGLFLYNLFLCIFLREKSRFYYLLYLLTITLYFSAVNRLTTEFFFRQNPVVSTYLTLFFLGVSSAFAMLFAKTFLSTRKIMPVIDTILNILIIVSLGLSAGVFLFEYSKIINYFTTMGLVVPVVLMITGITAFRRGNRNARFYIWASFVFLAGTIVFSLTFKSVLPYNNFTFYNFQIAAVIEAVLLSIALADRINILNTNLERVNRELKSALEIAHLGFHDHLTGLYNHRFFEEELRRLDTKRNLPITLVVGDVNGLKLTNDVFGHLAGDNLLRKAAGVLKKECRSDDIIARTGGDEFVIILPGADRITAETIVRRIKISMHGEKAGILPVSVSFGLAAKESDEQDITDIYKQAEDLMYKEKLSESNIIKHQTIETIKNTLYSKNPGEELHAKKVSELCAVIGKEMNLRGEEILELKTLGMMHDIGNIAIAEEILNSTKPLSGYAIDEVKRHSEHGYRILSSVNEYAKLADYVLAHHERWDGRGYPRGIKALDIPLQSRILAIADAYTAMTTERPYRRAVSAENALKEIESNAGIQFDPGICKLFLTHMHGQHG